MLLDFKIMTNVKLLFDEGYCYLLSNKITCSRPCPSASA